MKCKLCNTNPDYRVTGWQPPHPVEYCPVCKRGAFVHLTNAWTNETELIFTPVDGTDLSEWYKTHRYDWR